MKTYKGSVTPDDMVWSVTVDEQPLDPRNDLRNHSPSGFAWGFGGSGPAQLALALLCDCLQNDERVLNIYQPFKWKVIAGLEMDSNWEMTEEEILNIVDDLEEKSKKNLTT